MGGNGSTYMEMEILKVNNGDFEGVVSGSNKYENKINHIEISNDRMQTPDDPLTEGGKRFYDRNWGS